MNTIKGMTYEQVVRAIDDAENREVSTEYENDMLIYELDELYNIKEMFEKMYKDDPRR